MPHASFYIKFSRVLLTSCMLSSGLYGAGELNPSFAIFHEELQVDSLSLKWQIQNVTQISVDEVSRQLATLKTLSQERSLEEKRVLQAYLSDIRQPEELVQQKKVVCILETISADHSSFAPLNALVKRLREADVYPSFQPCFEALAQYYESYSVFLRQMPCTQRPLLLQKTLQLNGDAFLDFYRISKSLAREVLCVDGLGFPLKKNSSGTHRTNPLKGVDENSMPYSIHFKVDTHDMDQRDAHPSDGLHVGHEYAVYALYKLLGLDANPSTLLTCKGLNVKFLKPEVSSEDKSLFARERDRLKSEHKDSREILTLYPRFKELLDHKAYDYAVQASRTVIGEDLEVYLDSPLIDFHSLSAQFIGSLLVGFGDAKGDNFKVTLDQKGKGHIIGIDNEDAFVRSIQKIPGSDKHEVKVKNIFYTCENWLKQKITLSERERFLSIPASVLLLTWLHELDLQNKRYATLQVQGSLNDLTMGRSGLPVMLPAGTLPRLYQRLNLIQECLSDSVMLTHQGLLERIDPLVALYYKQALFQAKEEREAKRLSLLQAQEYYFSKIKALSREDPEFEEKCAGLNAKITYEEEALRKLDALSLAHVALRDSVYAQRSLESFVKDLSAPLGRTSLSIREALEEETALESGQAFIATHYEAVLAPLLEKIYVGKLKKPLQAIEKALKEISLAKALHAATQKNQYVSPQVMRWVLAIDRQLDRKSLSQCIRPILDEISQESSSLSLSLFKLTISDKMLEGIERSCGIPLSMNHAAAELLSSLWAGFENMSHLKTLLETSCHYFPQALQKSLTSALNEASPMSPFYTLPHKAISENTSHDVIRLLWDSGFTPHVLNREGHSAVYCAVRTCAQASASHKENVIAILGEIRQRWPEVQVEVPSEEFLLERALKEHDKRLVRILLSTGTDKTKFFKTSSAFAFWKHLKETHKYNRDMREAFEPFVRLNPKLDFWVTFETFFPIFDPQKSSERFIESGRFGKRSLHPEVTRQLFDPQTGFKKRNEFGRHKVVCVEVEGRKLFFKQYPELPGLEYASNTFHHLLLGPHSAPYGELLKFQKGGDSSKAYPVLVSTAIEGENFETVARTKHHLLDALDPVHTSKAILTAMILNPEDGKFDNFIVRAMSVPEKEKTKGKGSERRLHYQLISVDNDHIFVQGVAQEQGLLGSKEKLQLKTALFCLPHMKESMPKEVQDMFRTIKGEEFLKKWLTKLQTEHTRQMQLLGFLQEILLKRNKNERTIVGIPFHPSTLRDIYEKLEVLKGICESASHLTCLQILHALEPHVSKRYQEAFRAKPTVYERFEAVTKGLYDTIQGRTQTIANSTLMLQMLKIPLKEYVGNLVQRGETYGPLSMLRALEQIVEERGHLEEIAQELLTGRLRRFVLLPTHLKQQILNTIEFSVYPSAQESARFLTTLERQPFQRLSLKEYHTLTPPQFASTFIYAPQLLFLDLRGCTKLTEGTLSSLSVLCPSMTYLNINGWQIKKVPAVLYSCLERLNVKRCANLTSLEMRVPRLKYVDASDNPRLTTLSFEAPQLKRVAFQNCTSLEEKILDEMSENCPLIQRATFQGCNLISYASVLEEWRDKGWDMEKAFCHLFLRSLYINQNFSITSLDLSSKKIGEAGVQALNAQALSRFTNLTSLDLSTERFKKNKIGAEVAQAFSALTNLNSLDLQWNSIGEEGARALSTLTNLTKLDLESNKIGDEGVQALSNLKNLTDLNLDLNNIKEGVQALSSLTNLTSLHLSANNITDVGAQALSTLTKLTLLNLESNKIGDEGVQALSNLKNLTDLDLGGNNIADVGAQALSKLTNLIFLRLQGNKIGDEGAQTLGTLTNLTRLNLGSNKLGASGVQSLSTLTNLTELSLGYNQIGAAGAQALSALTNLTKLHLSRNNIGALGAQHLNTLTNLTYLYLIENNIGDAGAQHLSALKNLTELFLHENNIGVLGAQGLSTLTNLTELDLWKNNIRDEGAQALGTLTNLIRLNLEGNNVGDAGAQGLWPLTNLTYLDLNNNNIGALGAQTLSTLTNLTELTLNGNKIGDVGARALSCLRGLKYLGLQVNNVREDERMALRKALPNCIIYPGQ